MSYVWMKITPDKYELPIAVADTAEELATMCGVTKGTIYSCVFYAEKKGMNTQYRRVKIEKEI